MDITKRSTLSKILTIAFALLTVAFIVAMIISREFFNWTFARHENILSWILRPLIPLPLCYFAYKRSGLGISISLFLGLTSMFWFSQPDVVNERVVEFLAMEKDYLTTGWTASKMAVSALVPISLTLLGLAFWKRSWKAGVGILVAIAVTKSLWSVLEGGEAGQAVLIPAALGLVFSIAVIYYFIRRSNEKKKENHE